MDDKYLSPEEIAELWEAIRTTGRLASYMPSLKKMCDMALRVVPEMAKDAQRWRQAVRDKEFPIYRNGEWMHVCRTTGKILIGATPEEVMDLAIDAAIAQER